MLSKLEVRALERQQAMAMSGRELAEILLYRLVVTNALEFIPVDLRLALWKELQK